MTIGSEHHGDAVMPPNVGNKEQYHYDTTMYHSPPTLNKYHLCLEVGPLPPTRPRRSLKMTSRTSRKKTSRPRNRSLPARRIAAARVVQRSEMPIDPGFFRGVKKENTHTHTRLFGWYTPFVTAGSQQTHGVGAACIASSQPYGRGKGYKSLYLPI